MRSVSYWCALLVCMTRALAAAESIAGDASRVDSPRVQPARNILFILVDDQRFDAMSCVGHPFLKTPAVDLLAAGGVRFANAFVTTSLCSPSRASILTGLYAHTHGVVDNQTELPAHLVVFPELLQKAGYRTAFIGKWHMGHASDKPQRGFDHWVGFAGQGSYFPDMPDGRKARLNVDGRSVEQTGYITDELTDYAIKWLTQRTDGRPWMLYLSHKAAHHDFRPAPRHQGRFARVEIQSFPTTQGTPRDEHRPMWARNQRNSWHGAEFPFHGSLGKTEDLYRRYCETLLAVDESTQRLIDHLRAADQLDDTLILYMGDNGHLWGEHGLIDKRTAYEPSIRVPMLMHCPRLLPQGRVVSDMAAGIDIAPTVLDAAGISPPAGFHGRSLLPAARGDKSATPRTELLYEYFWERWAPATPTLHALLTPRWKYVRPYGLWDIPELYDLQNDPHELENLYAHRDHHQRALEMDKRLFQLLRETGGLAIPFSRGWNGSAKEHRVPAGSEWAPFPKSLTAPSRP